MILLINIKSILSITNFLLFHSNIKIIFTKVIMKMSPNSGFFYVSLFITVSLVFTISKVQAHMAPSNSAIDMSAIVKSSELTKQQKVDKLIKYFEKEPSWWSGVLYRLDRVDKTAARNISLKLFRDLNTSRVQRYELGRYILRTPNPDDPKSFISEYRKFLIDAILNGGEKEFFKPNAHEHTAVGEYAGIAGGTNRPEGILFAEVADKRVIPILIRCLPAPDHVYPKEQGCVVQGKPGEPTGRNTQRQGIPLALAQLGATEAISDMKRIAESHHDKYLRYNCAYSLAILLPKDEAISYGQQFLGDTNETYPAFGFGKGLATRQISEAINYFSPNLLPESYLKYFSTILSLITDRLNAARDMHTPGIAVLVDEYLDFRPFRDLLLHSTDSLMRHDVFLVNEHSRKISNRNSIDPEGSLMLNEKYVVRAYKIILQIIENNNLQSLKPRIVVIGQDTANKMVREATQEFIKQWAAQSE
jgi:hypothetical protein